MPRRPYNRLDGVGDRTVVRRRKSHCQKKIGSTWRSAAEDSADGRGPEEGWAKRLIRCERAGQGKDARFGPGAMGLGAGALLLPPTDVVGGGVDAPGHGRDR